jgi:Family of unknown function (DUF6515)
MYANRRLNRFVAAVLALGFLSAAAPVLAQRESERERHESRHEERHEDRRDARGYVLDGRYGHDHYYPPRGRVIDIAPRGAVIVRRGGVPYYFHEGAWYRPWGPRFVVVRPPIGLFVTVLPPFYSTIWVGGLP